MLLADHTPLIFLKAVLNKLVHSWTLCPIWLPSYWKDFLKVTEAAIGNSLGDIEYNRKLRKTSVKCLKNTCYSVHFWKDWRIESFIDVLQRLNIDFNNTFQSSSKLLLYIQQLSKHKKIEWKFLCFESGYEEDQHPASVQYENWI